MKGKLKYTPWIIGFIILFVLVGFSGNIINLITNIQWFKEVDYLSVYFTRLKMILLIAIPLSLVIYLGIALYYRIIKKAVVEAKDFVDISDKGKTIEKLIFRIANFIISITIGLSISYSWWNKILQYINATSFDYNDPIFNKDVSFYIFKLPLLKEITGFISGILIALMVITFVVYLIFFSTSSINENLNKIFNGRFNNGKVTKGIWRFFGKQLASVSALFLITLCFNYMLKAYDLVYSPRGVTFGASYTDIHVTLRFYRIISIVCIISAILVFVGIFRGKKKLIVFPIVSIVILVMAQAGVSELNENLYVKSNQRNLEREYINYNIEATRKAFSIDDIKTEDYELKNTLTSETITENEEIIDNIKINSYKPALEFYNQVQTLKYFYDYKDIDVDRYTIDGKVSQVFIAPRELNIKALAEGTNTWESKHLLYTHGYGVAMSKVNSITESGKPNFIIKDIPINNTSGIDIDNPRIYFGEEQDNYAIVNTKSGEIDYPQDGGNEITRYDGNAGIKLNFFNKLLYAIKQRNIKLMLTSEITNESKIMFNRNILERVNKIAPFLSYEDDPYMVISEGKLYWIIDAYTESDKYPLAQRTDGINYIRNAVKVVIDAYNGDTNFYVSNENDPIIKTYEKIYLSLFKNLSELSDDIKSHFRYAERLFDIQSDIFGKYHVTDPDVLFDGSDLWQVSQTESDIDNNKDENTEKEIAYQALKLPGEDTVEMGIVNYFNVRNKKNMSSMLVGRMDGDKYGELIAYRFPSDKTVYSPYLFQMQLKQEPTISKELTLLNSNGSKVSYGDNIVIPINNSLLYVVPIYIRATGENSIPEVKKIVVSNGDKTVMGSSMDEAITMLIGEDITGDEGSETHNKDENKPNDEGDSGDNKESKKLQETYNKMMKALKDGDWTKFGEYQKELGEIINNINK